MAPLDFWRNEKVEYVKGDYGSEPIEVVRIPKQQALPLSARARGRKIRTGNSRSKSRTADDSREDEGLEGEGIDDETEPLMQVLDYISGQEAMRRESLQIGGV
jgi:centromere protein C